MHISKIFKVSPEINAIRSAIHGIFRHVKDAERNRSPVKSFYIEILNINAGRTCSTHVKRIAAYCNIPYINIVADIEAVIQCDKDKYRRVIGVQVKLVVFDRARIEGVILSKAAFGDIPIESVIVIPEDVAQYRDPRSVRVDTKIRIRYVEPLHSNVVDGDIQAVETAHPINNRLRLTCQRYALVHHNVLTIRSTRDNHRVTVRGMG